VNGIQANGVEEIEDKMTSSVGVERLIARIEVFLLGEVLREKTEGQLESSHKAVGQERIYGVHSIKRGGTE